MAGAISMAVAGAGRMGQAIAAIVETTDDLQLAGVWKRGDDLQALVHSADVLIDFSLPGGTDRVLDVVAAAGIPLVCGVTGLDDRQLQRLDAVATEIAVVYDRNMSRGIAVLDVALRQVAHALPAGFSVAVTEVHHVHKKDAPSGTALKLAEALAEARGVALADIAIASERRGEVPGDHEVSFISESERLTLLHSVTSRTVFAEGAIAAARWIVNQPAGRYSMRHVLFGH